MPKGMQAIYSNVFNSNSQISFNNIPQTFTDLKIVVSQRNGSANLYEALAFRFDSTDASYSHTSLSGDGSSTFSSRVSAGNGYFSYNGQMAVVGGNASANVFGNYELYIPNYTSSQFKAFTIDGVTENNGNAISYSGAGLYRTNAPITFFQVGGYTVSPVNGSTVSIYGISR